ncbi:MAG TPA: peptidase M48, partial [Alicycliphilus sp.]|nr:peptidase M48 [Alicycliphilus sp.]
GLQADVAGDAAAVRQARLLGAELELAAGDAPAALSYLQDSVVAAGAGQAGAPKGRPEMLLRTQALLHSGSAAEMTAPLQTWLATHPGDATAWQALAQVWQQQKQPLRAVRAEAEAQVARYDYAAAVDRFKAGQDLAKRGGGDYIEASIIDTRLRAVQSLLKEQAAQR